MNWTIDIEFKKGPAFSCTANAPSQQVAELAGVNWARQNGFTGVIRSIDARVMA